MPDQSFISAPWVRVAGQGGGPVFLLIHGLVVSSTYFGPLVERLAERGRVYAPDLPGFGRSRGGWGVRRVPEHAAFLLEWLHAEGIEECHVIGHSLGAQIGAHLALLAPQRVRSLTLIGPTIDAAAHRLLPQILRLLRAVVKEPPRLWANLVADFLRAGLLRTAGTVAHMFADYLEIQLPRITVPTLVLRGADDPISGRIWCESAAHLARGEFREIPGGAHCVHFSQPSAVAAAITDLRNPTARSCDRVRRRR